MAEGANGEIIIPPEYTQIPPDTHVIVVMPNSQRETVPVNWQGKTITTSPPTSSEMIFDRLTTYHGVQDANIKVVHNSQDAIEALSQRTGDKAKDTLVVLGGILNAKLTQNDKGDNISYDVSDTGLTVAEFIRSDGTVFNGLRMMVVAPEGTPSPPEKPIIKRSKPTNKDDFDYSRKILKVITQGNLPVQIQRNPTSAHHWYDTGFEEAISNLYNGPPKKDKTVPSDRRMNGQSNERNPKVSKFKKTFEQLSEGILSYSPDGIRLMQTALNGGLIERKEFVQEALRAYAEGKQPDSVVRYLREIGKDIFSRDSFEISLLAEALQYESEEGEAILTASERIRSLNAKDRIVLLYKGIIDIQKKKNDILGDLDEDAKGIIQMDLDVLQKQFSSVIPDELHKECLTDVGLHSSQVVLVGSSV